MSVLLADCVIENLERIGFIAPNPRWKHNTRELYYTASFEMKINPNNACISYSITVENGRHVINESSVRLHERKFSEKYALDFGKVFRDCRNLDWTMTAAAP